MQGEKELHSTRIEEPFLFRSADRCFISYFVLLDLAYTTYYRLRRNIPSLLRVGRRGSRLFLLDR